MGEKCFCHLNGYAVKDATARKEIEEIKKTYDANLSEKLENKQDKLIEGSGIKIDENNKISAELNVDISEYNGSASVVNDTLILNDKPGGSGGSGGTKLWLHKVYSTCKFLDMDITSNSFFIITNSSNPITFNTTNRTLEFGNSWLIAIYYNNEPTIATRTSESFGNNAYDSFLTFNNTGHFRGTFGNIFRYGDPDIDESNIKVIFDKPTEL